MKQQYFLKSLLLGAAFFLAASSAFAQAAKNIIAEGVNEADGMKLSFYTSAGYGSTSSYGVTLEAPEGNRFIKTRSMSGKPGGTTLHVYVNGVRGPSYFLSPNLTLNRTSRTKLLGEMRFSDVDRVRFAYSSLVVNQDGERTNLVGSFEFDKLPKLSSFGGLSKNAYTCRVSGISSVNISISNPRAEIEAGTGRLVTRASVSGQPVLTNNNSEEQISTCAVIDGYSARVNGVTTIAGPPGYNVDSRFETTESRKGRAELLPPISRWMINDTAYAFSCANGQTRNHRFYFEKSKYYLPHLFYEGASARVEFLPGSDVRGRVTQMGENWDRIKCSEGAIATIELAAPSNAPVQE